MNGLLNYHFDTDSFSHISFSDRNKTDLSYKYSVRQLLEDKRGNIWAVAIYGIARREATSNRWQWFTQTLDSVSLLRSYMFCITQTHDSLVLAGHLQSGQLFYFDAKQQGFKVLRLPTKHTPTKTISCVQEDNLHNIWYGSMESGLVCYNRRLHKISCYKAHQSADSLQSNEISCLFLDSQHRLWVGTINGGLSCYVATKNRFVTYKHDDMNKASLSSNSVSHIFEDNEGNLCITSHNGLNVIDVKKNKFGLFAKSRFNNSIINHSNASCFFEATDGTIWVGCDGGGLQALNRNRQVVKSYTLATGLSSNAILDIEPNGDGQFWLATWGGGIMLFNPQTGKAQSFTQKNSAITSDNIKGIVKQNEWLWIGTHGQGVNLYNCKTHEFFSKEHLCPKFRFDYGKPQWINDITIDRRNNLWIYTTVGLYRFDGKVLHEYIASQNDSLSLSGLHVKQVIEDQSGQIWIAANGLDRYNSQTNTFIRYNQHNASLPAVVNSIEETPKGVLWLSSNNGLYRYDVAKNEVIRFIEADGLQGNRFGERASMLTANGMLFFGGTNGFNSFLPQKLEFSRSLPAVHINSCKILAKNWGDDFKNNQMLEVIGQKNIQIAYEQSFIISFSFVAPTLHAPEHINYQVQLNGFKPITQHLGNQTTISYTSLAPGTYQLLVWASDARGNSRSKAAVLHFEILPPWYKTLWFKILLNIIIIIGLFAIYYLRSRMLLKRNAQLTSMVAVRTALLSEQNQLIQSKNKELQETLQTRDQLLAIVFHDIKNPLNVLSGFASLLEAQYDKLSAEKQKQFIANIANSAQSLQKQVVEMLDWAVAQSGKLLYEPQQCNMYSIVADVVSQLHPISKQKEINVSIHSTVTHNAWCDIRMMNTVLRNIIGNSCKFTHQHGTIAISLFQTNDALIVEVSDTGIGISPEKISTLFTNQNFEVSYGTNNEKGIGLGLKVCKEFIEKNRGFITISSIPKQETTVRIELPLGTALGEIAIPTDNGTLFDAESTSNEHLLLVVEDNKDMQQYLKLLLEPQYCVEQADNGKTGFDAAQQLLPDLILVDIEMPGMSGLELCKLLKNNTATNHIPIIIISAQTTSQLQMAGLRLGVNDYVTKPFDVEVLSIKIRNLLANRERQLQHLRMNLMIEPQTGQMLSEDEEFLRSLIAIIEENLAKTDLSVEFLAGQLHLSRQQLTHKLKAIIGQAPVDFIRSYRLKKAAQLLDTNRFRISEIAYEVGFSDPKYFTTCFTKEFGVPPSVYVKNKE